MALHNLHTMSCFFQNQVDGKSNFELREFNKNFKVGDVLNLIEREDNHPRKETGRTLEVIVVSITKGGSNFDIKGLERGFVILGTEHITTKDNFLTKWGKWGK